MSREAVNQIIDRAVADESFFEQLRGDPDQAIQGYDLDPHEVSAFRSGAYNVVVRGMLKDRADQAEVQARRAAEAAAPSRVEPPLVGAPTPPPPKTPIAGLVTFFLALFIIAGGIGAFRYTQSQWPWQAFGFGREAAPASIPAPSLGARPKPSTTASGKPAASAAQSAPSSAAAAPASSAGPTAKPSTTASGQAQLRPSVSASPAPSGPAAAQRAEVEKAYYQSVGGRLGAVVRAFAATLSDLRGGSDPTKSLGDFAGAVAELRQHIGDAPPPDQLRQQHSTLTQAIPLMQSNADQLKSALEQKNTLQAILIAAEIDALLNQLPDEVAFATAPHPEIYQQVDSAQQLGHVLNFEVLNQNVTTRNNTPASVVLRIGIQSANPSNDEVSDTLRHGVVAARQSFPQAGQVRVVGFKESNGAVGAQVGTADWYCSPDARPPDAASAGNWQDSCSKIYLSISGGGTVTTVPY
jgi:hypothetical protein